MADPILPHSPSISAYMSVHEATNLAYVRYFSQLDATSATFKRISSQDFSLDYVLSDGSQGETSIRFKTPLTDRNQIRPVLEAMAKEAEEALGLPSSLSGPPPLKAIAKAMMASPYTPEEPVVALDQFRSPHPLHMLWVTVLFGSLGILTYTSEAYLERQFTSRAIELRHAIGLPLLKGLLKLTGVIHALEGAYTFTVCQRRGWYSPLTTLKWFLSTSLFGAFSIRELKRHANDVYQTKSD